MRFMRSGCSILCLLPVLCLYAPQEPASQADAFARPDLIYVDVVVMDAKGNLVPGLGPGDFEILDEGKPQEIVYLSQRKIPLAIALLVPTSEFSSPRDSNASRVLDSELPKLRPGDRVCLFAFSDGWMLATGLTSDVKRVARRAKDFNADSGANVNNALYFATDYLRKKAPQSRRVVILMGHVTNYTFDLLFTPSIQVEKSLLNAEVSLFVIRQGLFIFNTKESGAVNVDELAAKSGGLVIDTFSQGDQEGFGSLIETLKSRYTLGFRPNTSEQPGSLRKLTVRLTAAGEQKVSGSATLRYRTQYIVPRQKGMKSR